MNSWTPEFVAPLPHPGELLREDYLPQYGLTAGALAKAMKLKDRTRVERLIRGAGPVTPDTALRLGRVFETSALYWMNLQAQHDLSVAAIASGAELLDISPITPRRPDEPT
jgi:addiction module HigA family antidote